MIKIILLKVWGWRKSRIQTGWILYENLVSNKLTRNKFPWQKENETEVLKACPTPHFSPLTHDISSDHVFFCKHLINIIRSRLWFTFQKENMLPVTRGTKKNTVSDMSAADWLSQTHIKNYCKFSCVEIILCFFSHRWKSL